MILAWWNLLGIILITVIITMWVTVAIGDNLVKNEGKE